MKFSMCAVVVVPVVAFAVVDFVVAVDFLIVVELVGRCCVVVDFPWLWWVVVKFPLWW